MQVGRNITFIKLLVRNFLQTTQTLKKVSFFDKDISNNKAKVHFFLIKTLFLCMIMHGYYCNNLMPYESFGEKNSFFFASRPDVTDCKLQTEQFYSLMEKGPFFPLSSCLYSFRITFACMKRHFGKNGKSLNWESRQARNYL